MRFYAVEPSPLVVPGFAVSPLTFLPALPLLLCASLSAKDRFVAFLKSLPRTPRGFAPPKETSVTGAVILAWLRREGHDRSARLSALSSPTLVLDGEQDALPVAVSAELAALLPHAQRQLIPHSGHLPFCEAPELFFSLVDSFLEAPSSGASRP